MQLTATTADGYISERLEVTEIDEQGRFTRTEIFDVDDLARAVALLDDWYIAGEGRPDAAVLEALAQTTLASNAKDWARFPSLYNPDFTFVDHTTIGWPELDLDGYIAIQQSYVDQVHVRSLIRWVRVRGRTALGTSVSDGTDPDGGTFEWVFHGVSHFDADHRLLRTEVYAENDFAAALARFDELAAEGDERNPEIENPATRSMARFPELARARRFDAIADLIAPDYVRIDHRRGVPAPTAQGPDDFVAIIRATLDVGFDEISNTPLAVRGDQLALSRVDVRAPDGREIVFLQVHEWDCVQARRTPRTSTKTTSRPRSWSSTTGTEPPAPSPPRRTTRSPSSQH